MKTIQLREWDPTLALELTPDERDALRSLFRANIQPAIGSVDRFDVQPGNLIGGLLIGQASIVIKPKIPISNVLFLLSYTADPHGWHEAQALLANAIDITDGLAGLFAALADRSMHRGLLAGYRDAHDDLYTVRGRVDIAHQLRRRPGLDLPLAARYVEFDHDILENRLLLAAANCFRGLPIRSPRTRRALHRLTATLQDVTAVSFTPSAVPTVHWNRLNQHYRTAAELARIVLRHRSVDVSSGDTTTPALVIDMAKAFEEFVRVGLREALAADEEAFPGRSQQPKVFLDDSNRVHLWPDLTYWQRGRCQFVGDVKYKYDEGDGRSADLYQLLAYATALHQSSAMLIYASGPPQPRQHHLPHTGVDLLLRYLDVAVPPQQILAQLQTLSREITHRSSIQPHHR